MIKNIKDYVRNDEFKITLKNNYVDIENYTNIGNISNKEIIIYNNKTQIKILGSNLSVSKMLNDEILIFGKYNNIIFEGYNE